MDKKSLVILCSVLLSAITLFSPCVAQDKTLEDFYIDQLIRPLYSIEAADTIFKTPRSGIYDEIFLPFFFDGKILPQGMLFHLSFDGNIPLGYQYKKPALKKEEPDIKAGFEKQMDRNAYLYYVDHYPEQLHYFHWNQPEKLEPEPLKLNIFQEIFRIDNNPDFDVVSGPERYKPGWQFWFVNGGSLIQFSQNYISNNWYKGGIGNLNVLSNQNVSINYKKDRIQINNYIEWNMSLYTNPNDTLRETKIGTDLFRTYSDFGVRAFNERWFYSANLEIKTQLFNSYAENTNTVVSALGAPLFVNIGVFGMKYHLDKRFKNNKYKRITVDADLSPLSVKITYVGDKRVDPTRYGIPSGDTHITDFGSMVNSVVVFNFNKNVSLRSRFKYFTSYKRMEIESENELNMVLNRYFSTRIYVYARFDDAKGIPKDPDFGYVQMNEVLSFGFNYKW